MKRFLSRPKNRQLVLLAIWLFIPFSLLGLLASSSIVTTLLVSKASPGLVDNNQEQSKKKEDKLVAAFPVPEPGLSPVSQPITPTTNVAGKPPATLASIATPIPTLGVVSPPPSTITRVNASVTEPRPLQGPVILVRLRPAGNGAGLIERLAALEPVRAGRLQPLDYVSDKDKQGQGERLMAVINQTDKSSFLSSGLEYAELDADADTARYYSVILPQEAAPEGETWLDEKWQILEQVGNRVILKVNLPFYVGFGAHTKLTVEKLPPRIYVSGLATPCPCPALALATFSTAPLLVAGVNSKEFKSLSEKVSEESLRQTTNQIVQNEVRGKGALNTRYTGSPGSVYLAERLYTYFFALGLKVQYDTFLEKALGTVTTNVIAEQPGEQAGEAARPVLLIAHYDSLGERNLKGISDPKLVAYGANDNGVGVAGLMEVARLLSPFRFKQPVRYIAFGAEEQGMLGSQHYAYNHLKPNTPEAVINIDSFGYNPVEEDWVVLAYEHYGTAFKDALVAYEQKYKIALRLEIRQGEAFFRSDDYYFSELGYSAVALTDSFAVQSPNNHTPDDTMQNVNFRTVRKVIQLALVTVAEQADKG